MLNELEEFTEMRLDRIQEVVSLAHDIWPRVYAGMITREQIDYMLDWMYSPEKIRHELEEMGIVYLLIELDEKPVGFCAFGPLQEGVTCEIHKIYLRPEFHGHGIGSRTMSEVEKRASMDGSEALELRVNRANAAGIALYRKCGFQIVAEDCREIGGGFVMDDYIFRKEI